jgi:hypothetical protein
VTLAQYRRTLRVLTWVFGVLTVLAFANVLRLAPQVFATIKAVYFP